MRVRRTLALLALFSVGMGYVEAAVVVYLRQAYYPHGLEIPLRLGFPFFRLVPDLRLPPFPTWVYLTEVGREAATMVMLGTVAALVGKGVRRWLGAFLFMFGIWDIFYYLFLKLVLNWPDSLFALDVLFLIPVPWVAPVIVPVLISCLFIAVGTGLFRRG